ncbi:MAG TPA: hypothetical protein VMR49_02900 [Candidatus Paceibacterota bacterium]|jgi:hypothetical protein|nr:hypothetical protein [Candidatus Paceibacterota bacterium]
MNKYKLEIILVAVFKTASFISSQIEFEAESFEKALLRSQEILKERKNDVLNTLDGLVKGENPLLLITESQKEELIKGYPTKVKLIETKTYLIDTV